MKVLLDHMSIPVRDKETSSRFYAEVFGVAPDAPRMRGLPLSDAVSLLIEEREVVMPNHYAYRVDPGDFDPVVDRIRRLGIAFGASAEQEDRQIRTRPDRSRSVYFHDPDGHSLEIIADGR
jgi:catechol 2,3-dioxygenase-like lactoylglutathione lyase family enzyme